MMNPHHIKFIVQVREIERAEVEVEAEKGIQRDGYT
jgi:hypothetical protein